MPARRPTGSPGDDATGADSWSALTRCGPRLHQPPHGPGSHGMSRCDDPAIDRSRPPRPDSSDRSSNRMAPAKEGPRALRSHPDRRDPEACDGWIARSIGAPRHQGALRPRPPPVSSGSGPTATLLEAPSSPRLRGRIDRTWITLATGNAKCNTVADSQQTLYPSDSGRRRAGWRRPGSRSRSGRISNPILS